MEVGSQPPLKVVPPADNEPSQPLSKQAAIVPVNSQPIKSLLSNLPSKQLVPVNSQPMESLLSNLPSKQLVPVNSQPTESLLSSFPGNHWISVNSQPMESLLSSLPGNHRISVNSQPMKSLLSNLSRGQQIPVNSQRTESSQQSPKQQPFQIPEASEKCYLEPHTLDLTTGPEETADDSSSSSSDGSDVIVHSESNIITIDVDLSTKELVMNISTQTDVVPCCRCEEAIAAIARLTHSVQTLSSRVDTFLRS